MYEYEYFLDSGLFWRPQEPVWMYWSSCGMRAKLSNEKNKVV